MIYESIIPVLVIPEHTAATVAILSVLDSTYLKSVGNCDTNLLSFHIFTTNFVISKNCFEKQ